MHPYVFCKLYVIPAQKVHEWAMAYMALDAAYEYGYGYDHRW